MLLLCGPLGGTRARACDAANPEVHAGPRITWCANATFWQAHQDEIRPFFDFADRIVPQLTEDFGFPVDLNFTVVVMPPVGYASTPTDYGPGVNISGDAFYDVSYGIKGFYGTLLLLHEFVNQWTGLANGGYGGWPTDWWANHRSPFPNAIDAIVLRELGMTDMADVQEKRFLPGGDSVDPQVPMFTDLFHAHGGWPMLQHYFRMLRDDGVRLQFCDPPDFVKTTMFVSGNPSALRAHYVLAYFNLATQADVRARFTDAGVGTAPPNWTAPPAFEPYTPDDTAIANIAHTHCRLKDAGSAATDAARAQFSKGDWAGAFARTPTPAACSSACTDECACDATSGRCVPTYLAVREAEPAAAGGTATAATAATSEGAGVDGSMADLGTAGCNGCVGGAGSEWPAAAVLLMAGRARSARRRRARRAGHG